MSVTKLQVYVPRSRVGWCLVTIGLGVINSYRRLVKRSMGVFPVPSRGEFGYITRCKSIPDARFLTRIKECPSDGPILLSAKFCTGKPGGLLSVLHSNTKYFRVFRLGVSRLDLLYYKISYTSISHKRLIHTFLWKPKSPTQSFQRFPVYPNPYRRKSEKHLRPACRPYGAY